MKTIFENGIVQCGNNARLKSVFNRAEAGEKITIGFIGGSITQGSLASDSKLCYAYRVYEWWKNRFPKSEFIYINAGIGGTTSHFGVARVDQDLMIYKPDFVIVEFSVNDEANDFFMETYEGLVRTILLAENEPAVMLLNNVRYDDGCNAQKQHNAVGRHYSLPIYSVKDGLYKLVIDGKIKAAEWTEDNLHPNDTLHALIGEIVGNFLDKLYESETMQPVKIPGPITANSFQNSRLLNNSNTNYQSLGFTADDTVKMGITDVFKNGWYADKEGARLAFAIKCSNLAVQYRKSVKGSAPVAKVTVDDMNEAVVCLDGNFDETWGDCLALTVIKNHMENKTHKIDIELVGTGEEYKIPFYITALIAS